MSQTSLPPREDVRPILEPGFEVPDRLLPRPPVVTDPGRREAAALIVLAVGSLATPEEIVDGPSPSVLQRWADPLEREEALAMVDLLLHAAGGAR